MGTIWSTALLSAYFYALLLSCSYELVWSSAQKVKVIVKVNIKMHTEQKLIEAIFRIFSKVVKKDKYLYDWKKNLFRNVFHEKKSLVRLSKKLVWIYNSLDTSDWVRVSQQVVLWVDYTACQFFQCFSQTMPSSVKL